MIPVSIMPSRRMLTPSRWLACVLLCVLLAGASQAAPVVNSTAGPFEQGQTATISGGGFGAMGGSIISWDDFEGQTLDTPIQGSSPIIGPTWSCQYGYSGLGARWDNTHTHSGSKAAHIDWGYPPAYSIRAFGWVGQGPFSQIYITYWRYMEGNYTTSDPKCNHKQFYLFGNAGTNNAMPQGMALMPAGTNVWGFYINNSTQQPDWNGTNNINTQGWNWNNTNGVYQRWEFWCKLNDPYTASNGVLTYWKDGVVGRHRTDYRHRFVDGEYTDFRLGHMAQQFTATAKAWFDDLYIASTQARVEIGNASTWSACTHREIQIPSAWSAGLITVTVNQGSFANGTPAYLYVVDQDGDMNAAGYPITVGGPPTYYLSVTNGSGDGRYEAGAVVAISADPAPSGKAFGIWVGDSATVADVNAASTTVTMPAADVSVTAGYVWVYQLTVNSGTGAGSYTSGTVVDISAEPAGSGQSFDAWTGDVADVADTLAAATTVTMPPAAVEITATYKPIAIPGDLNGDGFVGQDDLDIVLDQWGCGAPPSDPITDPRADASGDGFVGQDDLDIVLDHWGDGLPQ